MVLMKRKDNNIIDNKDNNDINKKNNIIDKEL